MLTEEQKIRLKAAVEAMLRVPFVDDVGDYAFEAILAYVKGLRLRDPLLEGQSKALFDVVGPDGVGYSAKFKRWTSTEPGTKVEFVIGRADIIKKAQDLGFPSLSRNSPEADLGAALIRHFNRKYEKDTRDSGVSVPRRAILIASAPADKNQGRRRPRGARRQPSQALTPDPVCECAYWEEDYPPLDAASFQWQWAKDDKVGLHGFVNGRLALKWYPNQTQFFEVRTIPADAYRFSVPIRRLEPASFLEAVGVGMDRIPPR